MIQNFTLTLLLLVGSIFLGCDKPNENTQELRPRVQPHQIQAAQRAALEDLDATKIKSGQLAYFVETQEVVTSEGPLINLISEWTSEVMEAEEEDGFLLLSTLKTLVDHTKPEKPVYKFEDEFAFKKISKETQKAVEQNPLSLKLMEKNAPAQKSVSQEITNVTFHDLVIKKEFSRPPEAVAKLEDCGGLESCEIEITKIAYEVVFHFSDKKIQKHQIEWNISPDVPFFATVLKQCATTLVPLDNLRVLVKQCQKVRDFEF